MNQCEKPRDTRLLSQYDKHGAALIHYCAALNLHELVSCFAQKGIQLDQKLKDRNQTPILIASVCNHEPIVKAIMREEDRVSNISSCLEDDRYDSHDMFMQMLNREFPRGVQVESSRLQVPAGAAGGNRVRNVSPSNFLPRQCGISEQESKFFSINYLTSPTEVKKV